MTSFGAVVRADSVRRLTAAGWRSLIDYGVRTIVDLRRDDELAQDPPLEVPVDVVHVPLSTEHQELRIRDVWRRPGEDHEAIARAYVLMLERLAGNFARAVEAVAEAPEGGVVVHCYAGKDRTGLVCAMLLRLAGVGLDDITADYALSGENVVALLEPWIVDAPDEEERAMRLRIGASPPQAMSEVLAGIERDFGSVRRYLLEAGAAPEAIERVRVRLV